MSDTRAHSDLSDSSAIEALVAGLTDAWNRGDARAFSARFADDGSFTNVLGIVAYGREVFELRHSEIFTNIYKGSRLRQSIGKLRFIRPDVAVVDVDAAVTGYLRLPPGVQA
ncbi:MAG: SgcJ/EcaC family oxidoreductase, partial [Terriglobales bacterium]